MSAAGSQVVSILMVDDRAENRRALAAILDDPSYRLVEAASGSEALKAVLREDFALVLLDVRMPEMDGFEVAGLLGRLERTRNLPIIFLTAEAADEEDMFRGYTTGAVDYLVKPLRPEVVRTKVATFARLFRQREEIRVQGERLRAVERREQALLLEQERVAGERKLQAALMEFRSTLDAVLDAVCIFDAGDLNVLYANEGVSALLGVDRAQLLNQPVTEVLRGPAGAALRERIDSLRDGPKATRFETEVVRADNTRVPAELLLQHIADVGRFVAVAHDITERKRTQEELARLYAEAKAALNIRDEFLAAASHELKTPLTALTMQLHVLQRRLLSRGKDEGGLTEEEIDARFKRSTRSLMKLKDLIDELMDVGRISGGWMQLTRTEVDLASLVREVAEHFGDEFTRAGSELTLRVDGPILGAWDGPRLLQVITNLVSNALKYGLGKPVEVTVEQVGPLARLIVRDHGIGIALEDQARIFERFERAVSGRHYGGLGLGLFIAYRIVAAHGGTIRVESTPGEGSAFIVELPAQPLKSERGAPGMERPSPPPAA
ncbi:MAG: ATP-binding protein [Myxococcota bacterium]